MESTQVMTASVSAIDMFRRWDSGQMTKWVGDEGGKEEVELTWEEFLAELRTPQTPKMLAGIAFHEALATMVEGEFSALETEDYTFSFSEFSGDVALGQVQEVSASKMYGDLLVRGRCDSILGSTIPDYKLTFGSFDAERYMDSFQWRFYLDIFGADHFVYQVFEGYEDRYDPDGKTIDVKRLHTLKLHRYPEMEAECRQLAERFHSVALRHPAICKMRDVEDL